MKKLLPLFIFLLFVINLSAIHNIGGVITYRHISGLTYEATVTTYTKASAQASRCELVLDWGDESRESIYRVNGPPGFCPKAKMGEQLGNDLQKNIYVGTHTYASNGLFMLSTSDPSRNSGINNIPQSMNIPLTLNSLLIADSLEAASSAQFLADPIINFQFGKDCSFNPAAFSPSGDILSFSLTDPMSGSRPISGSIPNGVRINEKTGELTWTPTAIGQFVFAIQVSQCRNNINIGYVTLDIQINVIAPTFKQSFYDLSTWPLDSNGNFCTTIAPGNALNLNLSYMDSVAPTIEVTGYGEALSGANSATFTTTPSTSISKACSLTWHPDVTAQRCAPYLFTIRGSSKSQTHLLETDISILIYVRDPALSYCDTLCSDFEYNQETIRAFDTDNMQIWPNPFNKDVRFEFRTDKWDVTRTLILYDASGRKVKQQIRLGNYFTLKRDNLPSGIYFYHITGNDKTEFIGKIIISD